MIRLNPIVNRIIVLFACCNFLILYGCPDNDDNEEEPVEVEVTVENTKCPEDDLKIENLTATASMSTGGLVLVVVKADVKCKEDPLEGVKLRITGEGISGIEHSITTPASNAAGKIEASIRMNGWGYRSVDQVRGKDLNTTVNNSEGNQISQQMITIQ